MQVRASAVDPWGLQRHCTCMRFFSDNAASVHPVVLEAIAAANPVDTAYDGDALSAAIDEAFSHLFDTKVAAFWVASGTAANGLALAQLCPPYGSILCHRDAHIQNDECGAPEFYTHGAKLSLLDGPGAKITPQALQERLANTPPGVHWAQPKVVSITNATEYGCVYRADEVAAIGQLCRQHGLGLHMDGARFANAVAFLGCHPADLTWRAGVDILSFGFVKNGGMSAEALILFDPAKADGLAQRRKRAGLLFSKGRFLAAQLLALLKDDLWLSNARSANTAATRIANSAGQRLIHPVEANEIFLRASAQEAALLRSQGFDFYDWAEGEIRLVVSWDQAENEIAALAEALTAL